VGPTGPDSDQVGIGQSPTASASAHFTSAP